MSVRTPRSITRTVDRVGHDLVTIERISMLNWNGFDPTGNNDSTSYLNAAAVQALTYGVGNNRGVAIELPSGLIAITDCVHIGRGAYQYSSVGLVGQNRYSTEIRYAGPTDGRPAIMMDGPKGFLLGNFQLTRSGAKGSSVGIAFGGDSGGGTQCLSGLILPVAIGGFNVGAYVGNYSSTGLRDGVAASELQFLDLTVSDCDCGVYFHNQNTLNNRLFLNASNCGYGCYINTAGQIFVEGGAGAENTIADFRQGTNAYNEVRNWRTERCNRVLEISDGSVLLQNVIVADYKVGHDGVAIDVPYGCRLNMADCDFGRGQIVTAGGDAGVLADVQPTVVVDATLCKLGGPALVNPPPANLTASMTGVRATAKNCYLVDGAGAVTFIPETVWRGRAAGVMELRRRIDAAGIVSTATNRKAGDPTTSDIADGMQGLWENTSTGVLKYWANRSGVLKSVALA